ncbi:MAG: hypothetical protein ACJ8CB_20090 [Ktedonobacteraceae bacterium]
MLFWIRPAGIPLWSVVLVVALDLAVLVSTIACQAPLHGRLDREIFFALNAASRSLIATGSGFWIMQKRSRRVC